MVLKLKKIKKTVRKPNKKDMYFFKLNESKKRVKNQQNFFCQNRKISFDFILIKEEKILREVTVQFLKIPFVSQVEIQIRI